MPIEHQMVCDGCGATLHGVEKGRFKHQDYLSFKNPTASLQLMNMKTNYKEHIFLTNLSDQFLNFCLKPGIPCLQQFVDRKRGAYNFHKQQKLREEASNEHLTRLERS